MNITSGEMKLTRSSARVLAVLSGLRAAATQRDTVSTNSSQLATAAESTGGAASSRRPSPITPAWKTVVCACGTVTIRQCSP